MAQLPYPAASFGANKPRNDDTAQRLLWKIAVLLSEGLGGGGVLAVTGAGTYANTPGLFSTYHALTDTVIGSIVYSDGSSFLAGATVKAGDRISGNIKSIVITSGTGELYKQIQ
jgi:hypothetical protein